MVSSVKISAVEAIVVFPNGFTIFVTNQDGKHNFAGQLFASCFTLPIILVIIITAWDKYPTITHQFLPFLNTLSACLDRWQLWLMAGSRHIDRLSQSREGCALGSDHVTMRPIRGGRWRPWEIILVYWYQGEQKNSYFTEGEKIRGSDNQWHFFALGIYYSLIAAYLDYTVRMQFDCPGCSLRASFVSDLWKPWV